MKNILYIITVSLGFSTYAQAMDPDSTGDGESSPIRIQSPSKVSLTEYFGDIDTNSPPPKRRPVHQPSAFKPA